MQLKKLEEIFSLPPAHMVGDGFRVHTFLPIPSSKPQYKANPHRMNPFIMLDYNALWNVPPSNYVRGVGVHPHRGFETVTISFKGKIAHHDSAGNSGVIADGEVQWMTAGSGILHKEYHEENFARSGGEFHMAQLWVNLPAKDKNTPPKYQAITRETMQYVHEEKVTIEVIAGEYNGVKGSATTFSPIHVYVVKMQADSMFTASFPEHFNTAFLVVSGEVALPDSIAVPENQFALFGHTGETIQIHAQKESTVLVLSGEPIPEPIAWYGPFVMNSQEELYEAFQDFNAGKYGTLED